MVKTARTKQRTAKFAIAPPQRDGFWNAVGIFPQAIQKKASRNALLKDAHDQVRSLGASDLKTVLAVAGLPIDSNATATDLATTVLLQSDDDSLVYLREFLRRRSDAIRHTFNALLPNRARATASPLRPLTRLLALYSHDITSLKEAFFLHLWQSNRTFFALDSDRPLPSTVRSGIAREPTVLADAISKAWSGRAVELFGTHELVDGTSVIVFNREYSPSIQRDFRSRFNLHFRCGFVVFGIPSDRKSMLIRCGNARIADALRFYFEGTYAVKFTNRQTQVFSDFDPKQLAARLLGDLPTDSPITLVAARFRRSSLPSGSPLSLSEPGRHASIHQDLRHLSENQAVTLTALDELEQILVDFQGRSAEIDIVRLAGGAIRMKLNDAGWDSEALDELKTSFHSSFGVPLDRSIDPRRLALGTSRIVNFLLNTRSEGELQEYQRDQLKRLIKVGLLDGYGPCMAEVYAAFCRVSWDMWTRAWIGWVLRGVRVRA